ncbi:hypothetical protein J6590_070645 [Homalodisca vitripennis]|nr:hypothetical protein J6590_070645 [Homalodisca vitripennis]
MIPHLHQCLKPDFNHQVVRIPVPGLILYLYSDCSTCSVRLFITKCFRKAAFQTVHDLPRRRRNAIDLLATQRLDCRLWARSFSGECTDRNWVFTGYGKFSMYIIFLSGLSIATSLLGSVDISFLLPAAECDLQLTSEDKGLIGSAYFIGTIASAHLSGFLADTMGRRYVILWSLALNVPTYVFGSLAPEFWTFFILKLISGIL